MSTPDPEETEQEALADLIEATSTEWEADFKAEGIRIGSHADFVANRLIASGFRRLSESGGVDLDAIRKKIKHAREDANGWDEYAKPLTGRAYFNAVGAASTLNDLADSLTALLAEVERLRLSESEIRREEMAAKWDGIDTTTSPTLAAAREAATFGITLSSTSAAYIAEAVLAASGLRK